MISSNMSMTRDEQVRALRRQFGMSESQARAVVDANPLPSVQFVEPIAAAPPVALPFRLTLPWSTLCSDNDHYGATIRNERPLLVMTATYRKAKDAIEQMARRTTAGAQPLAQPLTLLADVWVPDNRPHDVTNFAKCAHDALERIVYANDRWLYRSTWQRAGVDVDRPRAEITITLHTP